MRSESNKMEKKRSGTKKKLEESGHGVHKKTGEWFESFVERDMAATATGFGCMNVAHHLHASSINNGYMEDGDKYISAQVTETCDASGFSWDMRMAEEGSQSMYWDEEEVFNMPALINSMAEGLIITPPALQRGFNWLPPEAPFHFTLWAD